ncbi:TPA: hypothetical protein ACPZRY_004143 [Yersinia enterocolitica]
MFIPTDILRAALLCVAGEKETREYLKGVYITPTHIKATDGRALVMMEHGCEVGNDIDGVFVFDGDIPDEAVEAEMTAIIADGGNWYAVHYDENEKPIVQTCWNYSIANIQISVRCCHQIQGRVKNFPCLPLNCWPCLT